jgi:hypothetical protein
MGYYGASAYRGDYYRGDYYRMRKRARGDLLDWLGGVAGNVVTGIFGPPSPTAGPAPALVPAPANPVLHPLQELKSIGSSYKLGRKASLTPQEAAAANGGGLAWHRSRRMNVTNVRALHRALRRANGFKKMATKVLKLVGEKRHVEGFKKKGKR